MNAANRKLWDEATEEERSVVRLLNGIEIFVTVGSCAAFYYLYIFLPGQLGIY